MYLQERFKYYQEGGESHLPYHARKGKPLQRGTKVRLVNNEMEDILVIRDSRYELFENRLAFHYLLVRVQCGGNLHYSAAPQPKKLYWEEPVGWYTEDQFHVQPDLGCD